MATIHFRQELPDLWSVNLCRGRIRMTVGSIIGPPKMNTVGNYIGSTYEGGVFQGTLEEVQAWFQGLWGEVADVPCRIDPQELGEPMEKVENKSGESER